MDSLGPAPQFVRISLLSPCKSSYFDLLLDEGKELVVQPSRVLLLSVTQQGPDDSRVTDGSTEGICSFNTQLHEPCCGRGREVMGAGEEGGFFR